MNTFDIMRKLLDEKHNDELVRGICLNVDHKIHLAKGDEELFYEKMYNTSEDLDWCLKWLSLDPTYFDYVIDAYQSLDYYSAIVYEERQASYNTSKYFPPERPLRKGEWIKDVVKYAYASWLTGICYGHYEELLTVERMP